MPGKRHLSAAGLATGSGLDVSWDEGLSSKASYPLQHRKAKVKDKQGYDWWNGGDIVEGIQSVGPIPARLLSHYYIHTSLVFMLQVFCALLSSPTYVQFLMHLARSHRSVQLGFYDKKHVCLLAWVGGG